MKFNILKKTILAGSLASLVALTSCEEFGPVFTGKYEEPEAAKVYTDADFEGCRLVTIAQLKAMYTSGSPLTVSEDIYIKGQVNSSDRQGNFYRSFYIQDETGGIEVKAGKTGLYNTYKLNQWVYVKCKDLTLGAYGRMVQIGYESQDPTYESAYIDVQFLIDQHIFCGAMGDELVPIQVSSATDITEEKYLGMLCTVTGLTYEDEVFAIFHDASDNNIYVGDDYPGGRHGITSWALSETGCEEYLNRMKTGGDAAVAAAVANAVPEAIAVSQYFRVGSTSTYLQVRTSGYSRFADTPLTGDADAGVPDVTTGSVSLTGIMTVYNDNYQFSLNDLSGVSVQ